MDTLLIHVLNSLLYAAVLFLIAGGLSLIYGVMRIVNLAHGNLFAFGAFVAAWTVGRLVGGPTPTPLLYLVLLAGPLAAAALGALLEPTLLRPLYKRPEEYQLLITFGLQLILEDLVRLIWGPYPLTVSSLYEGMGSLNMGESIYPTYNLAVIVVGGLAAAGLWAFIYRTQFGVVLRATSQNMRMAQAMGVNVNRVYVQAFTLGCFMAGLGYCRPAAGCRARHGRGRADPGLRGRGHRRAWKPRGRADRSAAGGSGPGARDHLVPGG